MITRGKETLRRSVPVPTEADKPSGAEPFKKLSDFSLTLSVNNQKDVIWLPVNPPELEISDETGGKTYELSGIGEMNVIKGPALTSVSFSSLLPSINASYPFIVDPNFSYPDYYISKIRGWMASRRPVRFIFTGGTFNLNMAASINKFDWKEVAGSGDIEYTLGLKEYVFYGAKPVVIKNNQASTKQQSRPSDKEQPKTYTLVSGDTLIKVARIQLGNESRWREIQKLNGISDAELTRLQVGMKLKLPG
jgi:hypothetical protein